MPLNSPAPEHGATPAVWTRDADVRQNRLRFEMMCTIRRLKERIHAALSACYDGWALGPLGPMRGLGLSEGSGTDGLRTHDSTTDTTNHGRLTTGTTTPREWCIAVTRYSPQHPGIQHRYRAGAASCVLCRGMGDTVGGAEDRDIPGETASLGGPAEEAVVPDSQSRGVMLESGTTGRATREPTVQALFRMLSATRRAVDSLSLPRVPRREALAPKPGTPLLTGPDTTPPEPKYIIHEFGGFPGESGTASGWTPYPSHAQTHPPTPELAEPSAEVAL